jgi:Ca2+-transporting ATPase
MDHVDDISLIASTPGRLRFAMPRLYRAQPLAQQLESELTRHPAVTAAYANMLTGRVLLLFDPGVAADALLAELGLVVRREIASQPAQQAASKKPAANKVKQLAATPASASASPSMRPPMYPPWHLRNIDEALAYHASSLQYGLAQDEAELRLRQGMNMIPRPPPASTLQMLLNQFKSTPVILLAVSAGISAFIGTWAEAAAIGAVLVLNAAIGFRTEQQAEASMASLSELVDDVVLVRRDGELQRISSSHVVPGDILVLIPGTRIAADVRLLQAKGLTIDESPLTGESFPVNKGIEAQAEPTLLAERTNMAYRGTAVSTGTGLGLVVGTGSRTEAGAIEALTNATVPPPTATQLQLDQLGTQLVKVSTAMSLGIFGLGLLRGHDRAGMFRTSVALAIASVPEGLPAVATTSLARGLRQMREQQVLMRHLHAVDTIGAIQTICLDKTGTLTMNQMSATAVRSVRHALDGELALDDGDGRAAELRRLLQVVILCNESEGNGALASSPLQGSATENALLQLAESHGMQVAPLRQQFPLLSTELRAEGRSYMRTVHAMPDPGQRLFAVKGSPEEVLALCRSFQEGTEVREMDEAARQLIFQQNQAMAARQLRVLGVAYAEHGATPSDTEAATPPLTWVGLVGLADPLRPGVARVIQRFHEAGIRTVMLTGDQAGTAYEIGRTLHLNNGEPLNIVSPEEFEQIDPEQLRALAAKADIFSRVTPSDKLRIVKALQASGATVAMTGDGINDSPALRAADIGIAMGSGTDVALSVADVALKHDQLESLLDAVAQSRTISDNIRKSVHFLVSSNLSEILVVFGDVAFGISGPLTPFKLLWLNLLTDMLPAIAMGAEPAEDDVMQRAARAPGQPLIGKNELLRYAREAVVLAAGTLSAYWVGAMRHGPGARAGTIGFDALVLGQVLHALYCRFEGRSSLDRRAPSNRQLTLALGASLGLHGLAHLVPALRRLLGITPLGPLDLVTIIAGGGVPLLVNELARPKGQSKAATRASAERSSSFSSIAPATLSTTFSGHTVAGAAPA